MKVYLMGKLVITLLLLAPVWAFSQRTIVAIGDSNGASETGWVVQLKGLRPSDSIFNYSISGNTIGFDNLGKVELNQLKNIEWHLANAKAKSVTKRIDDVIILLGTNDCKKVFDGRSNEVRANLGKLIQLVDEQISDFAINPEIYIVSPPPIGPDSMLMEKYHGGNARLQALLPDFLNVALANECHFIDIYHELNPKFLNWTIDGIHLNAQGSKLVARRISAFLDQTAKIQWDDQQKYQWPEAVRLVEIQSPLDSAIQKAYFYPSTSAEPKPLIVSLHTWSGDYTQQDGLLEQILARDWNYIHPDFRGPNNSPKAMGSKFAIDDIDQAITFALEHTPVKPSEIHVIGASGGAYATLYTYMNTAHNIASFSAWVPISDIEAWYYQSAGRKNKYAQHILSASSQGDTLLNAEEARKRSPLYMMTPTRKRAAAKLMIFAGIHDGYQGSVPITQSLKFYNKVIADFGASEDDFISHDEMIDLVTMRTYPDALEENIVDRRIIYKRNYQDISVTIFEGRHEMLTDIALELVDHEN